MIQLKGIKAGELRCVVPEETDEKKLLSEFKKLAAEGRELLSGSIVVMDMQGRKFTPQFAEKIWEAFIAPSGSRVVKWETSDEHSRDLLTSAGMNAGGIFQQVRHAAPANESVSRVKKGLICTGTLRSGQKVEHDGDVIVIGHVNTGAEIYAKGHIIVLGKLQGVVHAGYGGDDGMCVAARAFECGQIRIGTKVGLIDEHSEFWGRSAVISLRGDEVVMAEWPAI